MREIRIAGIGPGPKLSAPAPGHNVYPYLLRGVTAKRPNQMWDIEIV
jgi:putative transposase